MEDLKSKPNLTRVDISKLLASIGKPGKKRDEKLAAVKELGLSNTQGIGLEVTLESYKEF